MPLVTVVMAAHNAEETLNVGLAGALSQTMTDHEVVVVDDGSTDRSLEILQGAAEDNRCIRVLSSPRSRGAAFARNWAIDQSDSEYVAVMDADDISLPDRLQRQATLLRGDPQVSAVASQLAEFGTWGGPVPSSWPTTPEAIAGRQRQGKMPLPHPSTMFRRSELVRVGGYDEACLRAQDYALMLRLADQRLVCQPEVQVLYRTDRPVSLRYAVRSGRYGALARDRFAAESGAELTTGPVRPPRSLKQDLLSTVGWMKRSLTDLRTRDLVDGELRRALVAAQDRGSTT